MDHPKLFLLLSVFVVIAVLPLSRANDINDDRKALKAFSDSITNGGSLKWKDSATCICTSWVGVKCTSDGTRVHSLKLQNVRLTGIIKPNTLGQLNALSILDLSLNFLRDPLPYDVCSLPSLKSISLQRNNFSGYIPKQLPRGLEHLDLSFNSFTGKIPKIRPPNLRYFDFSSNDLSGSIRSAFKDFHYSSFVGNPKLCGQPLEACKFQLIVWETIQENPLFVVAVVATVLLVVGLFCLLRRTAGPPRVAPIPLIEVTTEEAPTQENDKEIQFISGHPVKWPGLRLLATTLTEVLGIGSTGSTYRVVIDNVLAIVVKRLENITPVQQNFEDRMMHIGRSGFGHPNVAGVLGYCYSTNQKLLLYNFFEGGSLMARIHGENGSNPLDWVTRSKIALRIARGMEYIHSLGVEYIHGNLKSSNVLMMRGCRKCRVIVTDMGLVTLLNNPPSYADGYQAPEVQASGVFSQKGDVYSFGVVLLELITGKNPYQSPRREVMFNLTSWVKERVTSGAEDLYDESIRNTNLVQRSILLQTALICTHERPEARPDMSDVVDLLRILNK